MIRIYYERRIIYALYLVLLEKKYPKWLALNLFSAVLFVVCNLGLPTILARMIDEGTSPRDVDRLLLGAGSCLRSFARDYGTLSCLTRLLTYHDFMITCDLYAIELQGTRDMMSSFDIATWVLSGLQLVESGHHTP